MYLCRHGRFIQTWHGQHVVKSVLSHCHVWSWDKSRLRLTDHTTFNQEEVDEGVLVEALMTHPFLHPHICRLTHLLGYSNSGCHKGGHRGGRHPPYSPAAV
jgi:hypothetical protein